MTHRCPTCGQKVKAPTLTRIERATDVAEWAAWLKHWADNGQQFSIRYWQARGHAYVPSRFPPSAASSAASEGASSND